MDAAGSGRGRRIAIGGRVLDSIDSDGEEDHYSLSVSGRQTLVIRADRVLGSTLDPIIVVSDENGDEVARDDDGGEGLNSRLRYTFGAGEYDVMVRGIGVSTGDYELRVSGGEREHSSSEEGVVRLGQEQQGSISSPREADTYRLAIDRPTDIVIRLNKETQSSLDPRLTLQAEDGEQIATDDDGGDGLNSLIRRTLQPGAYYVVAQGYAETYGDYVLSVSEESVSTDNLGLITGDRAIRGEITSPGERNTYEFAVGAQSHVTITMDRVGETGVDPYLELAEASGAQIAVNDDGGTGVNSLLDQVLEAGSYRLVARGYGSTTGLYDLTFRGIGGSVGASDANMGSISVGQTLHGDLATGVRDLWTLNLPEASQISIAANKRTGSLLDPHLRLLDDKGEEIAADDDGGEGTNALIRQEVPAGVYSIAVTGYARTSGGYDLLVQTVGGGARLLSFDSEDHGFGAESSRSVERGVAIGKYSFRSLRGDNRCWSLPLGRKGNGIYRVTTTKMAGPDSKGYGLAFRVHGRGDVPNMYLFEINANGQFRFRRRQDTDWTEIVRWTDAECIEKGDYAQNLIQIEADGSRFVFTINGTLVNVSHDTRAADTFAEGFVGFTVSEGLHVLFDNLEVPE